MSAPAEFERLVRECGPRIYALALRLTGNTSEGEDLAQETFLKAFDRIEQFRGDAEFSTWAYRICVNLWKNRVRYEKRRAFWKHFSLSAVTDDEGDPLGLQIPDPSLGIEANLEKKDEMAILASALSSLDAEDRLMIVLREMEDRSYEEISAILRVPLGTVKSRLARSRQKLGDRVKTLTERS